MNNSLQRKKESKKREVGKEQKREPKRERKDRKRGKIAENFFWKGEPVNNLLGQKKGTGSVSDQNGF